MATPEGFIMPDFGTAGEEASPTGRRKLALICSKGNLDMAYPGLILGNAAAAESVETHMFFTFWGLDIINQKTNAKLKFTMVGNTAMHMPELGRIRPGWEHRSMPQTMSRIPGMTWLATRLMRKKIAGLDVPNVPDFLDLLDAAGVHMYACRMTFDMMQLKEADMHPAVTSVITAGDFIDISAGAQTIFI